MSTNISPKYKDIISKGSLIRSGSPTVYQLKPKKEKIGSLIKKTVGEKNINKINKTILLVGETGTGKSTLVNALVNYSMGVKFEDNIWFEIVEEDEKGQTESQTSDVIVYEIFGFEDQTLPYSLTIIDTPGYGDTRGIRKDLIVSERLFDLFSSQDGVHKMNAVGLVIKASDNRLSDRLRYIFNSVASLFGKDMEKNIVALVTHSDGILPANVLQALEDIKIKCAKNDENQPVHFLFNNRQNKQRTVDHESGLESPWKITMKGMGEFTDFVERCGPQKLKTTLKVLKTRIRLTAFIKTLQDRLKLIEEKQKEVQQTQKALKNNQQEMRMNKNFIVEFDEIYRGKEKINNGMWGAVFYQGAVCCTVCEENCHYPCSMAWYPKDCKVMKKGRCTSCKDKCGISDHVKEDWVYVTKTRKVQRTEEQMKEKYKKNKAESGSKLSLLQILEKEKEELTAENDALLEESYQHVLKLEEIALNVNSVFTYVNLDFLIEKMTEKGDTEKAKKLKELKIRVGEGTSSGIPYMFGELTASRK